MITNSRRPQRQVEAARHLCQEARVVLTSLRGGPPHVARGELAQDLMELRDYIIMSPGGGSSSNTSASSSNSATTTTTSPPQEQEAESNSSTRNTRSSNEHKEEEEEEKVMTEEVEAAAAESITSTRSPTDPQEDDDKKKKKKSSQPSPSPAEKKKKTTTTTEEEWWSDKMSRPFLQVVMDPRAAGPHTLVALRAIYRLLEQGSFFVPLIDIDIDIHNDDEDNSTSNRKASNKNRNDDDDDDTRCDDDDHSHSYFSLENITQGILACKFEQTNAGQDEAVEMAIADVLSLLVRIDTTTTTTSTSTSCCISTESSSRQEQRQQRQQQQRMQPATLHEAFHTVFVTRNTFVHSPALCYHFEDVLTNMVESVFSYKHRSTSSSSRNSSSTTHTHTHTTHHHHHLASRFMLEFLVNQLLHTPLVGGDGLDESAREAAAAHDATRVLCLRLTRAAIVTGWNYNYHHYHHPCYYYGPATATAAVVVEDKNNNNKEEDEQETTNNAAPEISTTIFGDYEETDDDPVEAELISIIQDDLCLSLLMTGQAIWAYPHATDHHQSNAGISPGFVSLEVLTEICSTLSTLWNCVALRRQYLIAQFETIFTGFYTRACVLLRKRREATNSLSYNANLIFDAEIEIILESLLDILCLHDPAGASIIGSGINNESGEGGGGGGGGAALEEMFVAYDCHLRRSDVAIGLMVELCRCCDGTVDEEGEAVCLTPSSSSIFSPPPPSLISGGGGGGSGGDRESSGMGTTGMDVSAATSGQDAASVDGVDIDNMNMPPGTPPPPRQVSSAPPSTGLREQQTPSPTMVQVEHPWRQVPAHLKELCASALMGGMKCLFRDDKPSEATMLERSKRKKSILARHISGHCGGGGEGSTHSVTSDGSSQGGGHLLRDIKTKKRLMRKAARIFNKKASRGIEFLLDARLVPEPVTPKSVAQFLRNGIVVGLDKKAVGAYLGEAGKSPQAGKSPPCWERDWFHKECLETYCGLFRFGQQSLLDGLRMFLASFRLPGEAQQIDRILQAFADSCGQVCEESASGRLGLFSQDPKRASDAAYLLSFSIIMLNTDRHNANIREDRKMSMEAFVKNNTDYGRDITEKGKEFPAEYLRGIYTSINEEEIRTEGEGADGAMTVERWKDVLRGSTEGGSEEEQLLLNPSVHDAEDLTEIVLEHVWKPIMSAIGAFWNVTRSSSSLGRDGDFRVPTSSPPPVGESGHSRMLGVQGARLGMDMSIEMLNGVRQLGRIDIFREIFNWVCDYTGLLIQYESDAVERTWALTNSVEAQAAVVVAIRTALEAGEDLNQDGWKRVWSIIFELRDLKVLPRVFRESDSDLLSEEARRDWIMCLMKGDMDYLLNGARKRQQPSSARRSGVFGAFGRALFGSEDDLDDQEDGNVHSVAGTVRTAHGKEELVIWDELAPSDDEGDTVNNTAIDQATSLEESLGTDGAHLSLGALFEAQLIRESLDMSRQVDLPITGLERVEETRHYQLSPRARLRQRFRHACNWAALVSDSRFLDDEGIKSLIGALIELLSANDHPREIPPPRPLTSMQRSMSDVSISTPTFNPPSWNVPISPASEAFAEVLICEISTKNRDRLKALWTGILQDYYLSRLTKVMISQATDGNDSTSAKIPADPGLEKRVTGLLRLSLCSLQRGDIANEVLSIWKFLLPMNDAQHVSSPLRVLDPQISEGLYRVVSNVDGLLILDDSGWEGLLALLNWSAKRGCVRKPIRTPRGGSPGLPEDDPALKTYRSLHLLLNTSDLDSKIPCAIVDSLRLLVAGGDTRHYPQLATASLDLLHLLHEKQTRLIDQNGSDNIDAFWNIYWRKIVEAMAEAAERPRYSNVRQHALSMLTDLFLEQQNSVVPVQHLCTASSEICVPLAGRCILGLMRDGGGGGSSASVSSAMMVTSTQDELMIEFELCVGLIFKPLRHHLQSILADAKAELRLASMWKSILLVLEEMLRASAARENQHDAEDNDEDLRLPESLRATMRDLATEHLHSAVTMLMSAGVILPEAPTSSEDDISSLTWNAASRMVSEAAVKEWKMGTTSNSEGGAPQSPREVLAAD